MKDLLKEAIADAKAVRETALQNAKLALEETFAPRLQSIISAQLQKEEEEMEVEDEEVEMEAPEVAEGEETAPEAEVPADDEEDADDYGDEDVDFEDEEDDDLDLEEIIRELESEEGEESMEEELDSSEIGAGENKKPSADAMDSADAGEIDLFELEDEDEMVEGDMADDEEVDLEEVIKSLREEDEEEELEETSKEEELEEAYNVIRFLKSKINEVNLLNAKLLYSNKLFKSYNLNEGQKMKVIETFDRAVSLREVKLVYSTLAESFKTPVAKKAIKESFASRPVGSTKPSSKAVLSEGTELAARFKKLAGIIK